MRGSRLGTKLGSSTVHLNAEIRVKADNVHDKILTDSALAWSLKLVGRVEDTGGKLGWEDGGENEGGAEEVFEAELLETNKELSVGPG